MFQRNLTLPAAGRETFFLWGPRQTGKTTLLRQTYPNAVWIDLLKAEEYRRYLDHPEWLRSELPKTGSMPFVVIDEVQKLPQLLDEVHWLHENLGVQFALCGSSARKVRRGQANLLGGRAIRYELFGLTSAEIGEDWDINRMLNHGSKTIRKSKDPSSSAAKRNLEGQQTELRSCRRTHLPGSSGTTGLSNQAEVVNPRFVFPPLPRYYFKPC